MTKSHQDGIHWPLEIIHAGFFPALNPAEHNPRTLINITFLDSGETGAGHYIHYNNKFTTGGTRNEFRLTGLTATLLGLGARPGDRIEVSHTPDRLNISIKIN